MFIFCYSVLFEIQARAILQRQFFSETKKLAKKSDLPSNDSPDRQSVNADFVSPGNNFMQKYKSLLNFMHECGLTFDTQNLMNELFYQFLFILNP